MNKYLASFVGWSLLVVILGLPLFGRIALFLPLLAGLLDVIMFVVQSASASSAHRNGPRRR